jgi:hypothetical protein
MTGGAGLKAGEINWAENLQIILNSGWYESLFGLDNDALGGCGIDYFIENISERTLGLADLLILDFSVNDFTIPLETLTSHYYAFIQFISELQNPPAMFFHLTLRLPMPSLNYDDVIKEMLSTGSVWWKMHDHATAAMEHFGVPYISYRNLIWPNFDQPPKNLLSYWQDVHPNGNVHLLAGKLISYGILRLVQDSIAADQSQSNCTNKPYVTNDNRNGSLKLWCPKPIEMMEAGLSMPNHRTFKIVNRHRRFETHNWRYFADSKNKFGWIMLFNCSSTTYRHCHDGTVCQAYEDAHTLSIKVSVGENPLVRIGYLMSYATMGKVRVWLDDDRDNFIVIDAQWSLQTSITRFALISSKPLKPADMFQTSIRSYYVLDNLTPGTHIVRFTPHGWMVGTNFKWKLTQIATC